MENLIDLFGFEETEEDKKYTTKVNIPQYLPSMDCPRLEDCANLTKYYELMRNIDNSNVSEEEKKFLRFAATRQIFSMNCNAIYEITLTGNVNSTINTVSSNGSGNNRYARINGTKCTSNY